MTYIFGHVLRIKISMTVFYTLKGRDKWRLADILIDMDRWWKKKDAITGSKNIIKEEHKQKKQWIS
jgi:hypothetical protein